MRDECGRVGGKNNVFVGKGSVYGRIIVGRDVDEGAVGVEEVNLVAHNDDLAAWWETLYEVRQISEVKGVSSQGV